MLAGLGLVAGGLWARREVRQGLERERIVAPGGKAVRDASSARALAETIRAATLESTGGRTYSETVEYVTPEGEPTSDAESAATDALGRPVTNPDVELWIRATTLQSALMQAYMAFRMADLMLGVGSALTIAGGGIASAGRR